MTGSVGLVGLGTMGRGLAQALARAGLAVQAVEPLGGQVTLPDGVMLQADLAALAKNLSSPRRILLMVTAGDPVDSVLEGLIPLLDPGDIVLDGGNSHFRDTERREAMLAERGVRYLGVGISGGERGAREGASVMAGGPPDAYEACRDILEALAARGGDAVCCAHMGPGGAGHFVKMVHNGIEYAALQATGEAWHLLHAGAGLDHAKIAAVFDRWNAGPAAGFIMAISATVLKKFDDETGVPMIDIIDDGAAQTGTGSWMVTEAMALGVPAPTVAEAVAARSLSGMKEVRGAMAAEAGTTPFVADEAFVTAVGDALLVSLIVAYAQGFAVIRAAAARYGWPLREETVAAIWRKGCIIQSRLLEDVAAAYRRRPDLPLLLLDDDIGALVTGAEAGWRRTVAAAAQAGLPVPAMASALAWYDGLRSGRLWTALTQAQRDLFGAHTHARC